MGIHAVWALRKVDFIVNDAPVTINKLVDVGIFALKFYEASILFVINWIYLLAEDATNFFFDK